MENFLRKIKRHNLTFEITFLVHFYCTDAQSIITLYAYKLKEETRRYFSTGQATFTDENAESTGRMFFFSQNL